MYKIYHNRQSIRLKNYDYSKNGMYFVTICTKNREKILSKIVGADDPVRPSPMNTPNNNFPNNKINNLINNSTNNQQSVSDFNQFLLPQLSQIGKIINQSWYEIPKIYKNVKLGDFVIMPDHIHGIIQLCENVHGREGGQSRPPLHKIVQGFKSVTTRRCFQFGYRVIWQRNYYEHIIRNENEYFQICEYIKNNPINYVKNKMNKFDI